MKFRLPTFILLIACLLGFAAPAAAQSEGLTLTAEAGLDGACKENRWIPVRVTVENNGPGLEADLIARTDQTMPTWQFSTRVSLPTVSRKELTLYVMPHSYTSSIEVVLQANGEVLAVTDLPLTCVAGQDALLGVWAANPSAFGPQTTIRSTGARASLVILEARTFPDRPQGLEMLDSLTLSGVDAGQLSEVQVTALRLWVANGGRLVVSGGPDWQMTSAGLADILPLQPSGATTLDGLGELADFLNAPGTLDGSAVAATGALQTGAKVLFGLGDLPLVIERRYGFGTIVYLAVDPALEPLRTWEGLEIFYTYLIGTPVDAPTWRYGFQDWFGATNALNAIPGLGMPPTLLVCGFILAYIAVVGPLNFFLLRQLKRRESAWITIPVIVVTTTCLVLVISSSLIGNRPILHRLAIVEVWPEEERALVHGLLGVFSPRRETFTLKVADGFSAHPIPNLDFTLENRAYEVRQTDDGAEATDVRVDTGGLEGYAVTGTVIAPSFTDDLKLTYSTAGTAEIGGWVRNDSELTLSDVMILANGMAASLDTLDPGEQVSIAMSAAFPASTTTGMSIIGPGFSGDTTLIDLFGTNYMYPTNSFDIEEYRRFNLVSAALNGGVGTRGSGIYLFGWTEDAPFSTDLTGGSEANSDTTLYIVHLQADAEPLVNADGIILITPDLFSWTQYGTASGTSMATPYEAYLTAGSYALEFVPSYYDPAMEAAELILTLESYGLSGNIGFDVSLWDFSEQAWSLLPDLSWGETAIESPERFLGPRGQIRMQIAASGSNSVSIQRSDFTLLLRP